MTKKHRKLHGTVQKVIKPAVQNEHEKVEVKIEEADDLYRELRFENVVSDEKGEKSKLKEGEEVELTVEADSKTKPRDLP